MTLRIIHSENPLQDQTVVALKGRLRAGGLTATGTGQVDIPSIVRRIIDDVEARGDQAVVDVTRTLHWQQARLERLKVGADEIALACEDPAAVAMLPLMQRAIRNIEQYQQSIKVQAPAPLKREGRMLSVRYTPMERVAVYVPGGRALYPSSVLMTVVPARVAGVDQIVMVSPPDATGKLDSMVLALASVLGVREVYRVAGVAGLAALAIGTPTFAQVDKIVGPGSAFIAEAKRQLFGKVGIDSIAGPSEVIILADQTARADWVSADLLAQAEHDPGSAILITTSPRLAQETAAEVDRQLPNLKRSSAIRASLETYSAAIVVPDMEVACELVNDFASEHLQIIVADESAVLGQIRNAGAIFLGPHTPVAVGDYYAGPSHVLPTGTTARFSGPLSANDFLKASSIIRYDSASLSADAPDVSAFARREGFDAHAGAVEIRIAQKQTNAKQKPSS